MGAFDRRACAAAGHHDRSLVDLARRRALERPSHPIFTFLRDGEEPCAGLTLAQLDESARSMAVTLARLFRRGDRILLICPDAKEFIVAFFGCLYAGMLAVPAHPSVTRPEIARLDRIATDCSAAGICIGRSGADRTISALAGAKRLRHLFCVTVPDDLAADAQAWQPPSIDRSSCAFLQYTSGSTGAPKGVMVSHGNLLDNQRLIEAGFGGSRRTVVVSWLPLFHDMGLIGQVLHPLYLGASSVLMPAGAFFARPARWLQAISDHGATCSGGPNFAYDLCTRRLTDEQMAGLDLSRWEVAFTGAEPIRRDTLARFADKFAACGFRREAFVGCYGMAEATLYVSSGRPQEFPRARRLDGAALQRHRVAPAAEADTNAVEVVSCGRAAEQDIAIVHPDTRRRCGAGLIGEIWIRGASVCQGYWNRREESVATFEARLADGDDGPFLRTGDLGFIEGGELYVTGRVHDLIVIRGRHYYPHDIEATVGSSHPALNGGIGAAFCVPVQGEQRLVVAHEVHRHALNRVARDEVVGAARSAVMSRLGLPLQDLVLLAQGSLPKTSSGKVRRHASRDAYLGEALGALLPASPKLREHAAALDRD